MIEAIRSFGRGYVDFEGRSTRSDYWFVYLVNVLITFAYFLLQAVFGGLAAALIQAFWLLFHLSSYLSFLPMVLLRVYLVLL